MPCPIATQIVNQALTLRATLPSLPAAEIVHLAMAGKVGAHPDFTDPDAPGGSATDPRAPFGRLLQEGYGHLVDMRVRMDDFAPAGIGSLTAAERAHWSDVLALFNSQFALWETAEEVARRAWVSECLHEGMRRRAEFDDDYFDVDDFDGLITSMSYEPGMVARVPQAVIEEMVGRAAS